jgi:hypothetical protein
MVDNIKLCHVSKTKSNEPPFNFQELVLSKTIPRCSMGTTETACEILITRYIQTMSLDEQSTFIDDSHLSQVSRL